MDFAMQHCTSMEPEFLSPLHPSPLLSYFKIQKQIDGKELTSFVEKIIVDLEEEVRNGILSLQESEDLILLLTKASAHIFAKHLHSHK